ncbi:S8 family serine peptidase [bacterium]|nr:S8 family serine peptidase [bacterium]
MINEIRFQGGAPAPGSKLLSGAAVKDQPGDRLENNSRPAQEFRLADVLSATASEARSLAPKLADHVEGEVLVKLKPGLDVRGMGDFAGDYGAKVEERIKMGGQMSAAFNGDLLRVSLPEGMTTAEAMVAMNKDSRVAYAATNDRIQIPVTREVPLEQPVQPGQPGQDNQPDEGPQDLPANLSPNLWGLHNTGQNGGKVDTDIDAPEAWSITHGNRNNVIAVIDTGGDYTHKTLASNAWTNPQDGTHGYNAINDSHDPMDDHYHGTHCYGTIAGNGTDGVYGVNHEASIMPIKFLSNSGGGTLADAIKGIVFASDNGARLTSNSWGGGPYNQALKDAFEASPALHLIAAGNDSNNNDASATYPCTYDLDNIVSVAASDRNERMASFSNYGATTVDLAAPGVAIYSTAPGNKYKNLDGTSMATPHVSGVAGLIVAQYPGITNAEIKARLLNSVDDVPAFNGKVLTGGRLNAAKALAPDFGAPGTPNSFAVSEAKAGKVTLGWVASGDDGAEGGKAARYQVRVSDRPIVDGTPGQGQVSFEEATVVNVGRPGEPGSAESYAVDVPLSGQEKTYFFALRSTDKVGQASEVVTTSAVVPAAQLAFEDNGSPENFTTTDWGQVGVAGRGKVWTDSPSGDYGNNANSAITSKSISLANLSGSKLIFDARWATENKYDKVALEVSSDGQTWAPQASYTGSSDWKSQTVDLSKFDGQDIQFRFRLTSDGSVTGDGFSFGNAVIAGG